MSHISIDFSQKKGPIGLDASFSLRNETKRGADRFLLLAFLFQ